MNKYKKELVQETCKALQSYGYTVYISASKEYGFYTDGVKVVCFGSPYGLSLSFSGVYSSKTRGTGWQIVGEYGVPSKEEADTWIKQQAPRWATGGEKVTYSTPEHHLAVYGKSSGYVVFAE